MNEKIRQGISSVTGKAAVYTQYTVSSYTQYKVGSTSSAEGPFASLWRSDIAVA